MKIGILAIVVLLFLVCFCLALIALVFIQKSDRTGLEVNIGQRLVGLAHSASFVERITLWVLFAIVVLTFISSVMLI